MRAHSTSRPLGSDLAAAWGIDPQTVFLNHGSYGACPRATLAAQGLLRARMESELVRFFNIDLPGLLDGVRAQLAPFCGCDAAGLTFMPNATAGVATALANLPLAAGEEILAPAHEYPACVNNARRIAQGRGAQVRLCPLPFPLRDPAEVTEAVLGAVTERTRICLLSHITSSSGIILPVEGIAGELEARGIRVIIDGAHAPGQIELDIGALAGGSAPSCYVANLHKWLCAPKGAAMLWIREDLRASFRPLVLSNSAELAPPPGRSKLHLEFDYAGTGDMTPWLTIPAAMETMAAMAPGGWGEIRARNHDLALRGRNIVCGALGVESPAPDSMLGAMTTIVLPQHPPQLQERLRQRPTGYHDALQDALVGRWGIQIPVFYLPQAEPGPAPVRCLRLSAQLYNSPAQYEYLAEALRAELEAERRLG